jgi:hypothetical protein
MAVLRHLIIIAVFAAFISSIVCVDTSTQQNERQQSFNRASTERQQGVNRPSTERQQSGNIASSQRQQSVNDFGRCILNNPSSLLRHMPRINVLAAIMSKRDRNMVTSPVWKWASTERQRFCVFHLVWSKGCATACTHNWSIRSLYRRYRVCRYCYTTIWASTERQQSINRASIERQQSINTASTECQQSVNDFGCCILYKQRAVLRQLPIIKVLAAVMCKRDHDMVTVPVWKWASTEHQWLWVLHLV